MMSQKKRYESSHFADPEGSKTLTEDFSSVYQTFSSQSSHQRLLAQNLHASPA
jgi:hypothetical protein